MKKLTVLFAFLLVQLFTYPVVAQKISLINDDYEISFPEKIHKFVLDPLPAGTYSVGTGGYFPTIDSAFNKLSIDGVAGEVILELIDNLYVAPANQYGFFLNGPIPGAGPDSRVTIKPAANRNVIIEGSGYAELYLLNTSYMTIDGINLTGATTLTIHSIQNSQFDFNFGIIFANNSDHNVIQNTTGICEDIYRGAEPIILYVFTPGISAAADSNLIQHNFIKEAGVAILLSAEFSLVKATGNVIRENIVGSETDSLINWGIQAQFTQNTIIENNIVQNIRRYYWKPNVGINSYFGFGDIIRNNIVHNIFINTGPYGGRGILLSGDVGEIGINNLVYNNMVYDIRSSSTQYGARVGGIEMWYQDSPGIYYNSVYLDGNGNGANTGGSAALYNPSNDGPCTNIDARNNILINTRDESPYGASAIYLNSGSSFATSDYNDLYYVPNQYNCLVRIGGNDYHTLADWQATGQDISSITEMPNFIGPYLHISDLIPTYIEAGGIPISGIETDIDGDLRRIDSTDIGADEFNGIRIPVELTSFTASVNNKEIMLNWSTATELNNQGFNIERQVSSKQPAKGEVSPNGGYAVSSRWEEIGFVPGFGTTTEPKSYSYSDQPDKSGTYCYRLKQIDYNGSYEYSDVVEVEVMGFNSYLLEQNYPNPFNPTTTIDFGIQNKSNVKITVLNAIGEEVAVILNEVKEAGYHQVVYNAANLSSGVYIYKLQAGKFTSTKKMILLK